MKAPFVIYADFECLTQKTGSASTKATNTNNYQHHRPCGFMINSQQQNALGYNLSMQGIGTVAIDEPRFEGFWRSRKEFCEVSQGGVSQGGLATILLLGCTAGLMLLMLLMVHQNLIYTEVRIAWTFL